MRRSFFILLVLLFPIAAYAQQAVPPVVPRLLQVKLKESDVAKVQASRLSVSADSSVSVGIQRLDVLNQQFGVSKMQRVFPYAGEYEAKHRKYGLHLWYELVLDEGVDPALAADFYKATGEIEDAEPVYQIKRIVGLSENQDTTRYTSREIISSGISRSAVPNDPQLSKQWHYHNDGSIAGSVAGVDINLFDAWDITMGSTDIIVAVMDGGIDYMHEDLAANMWINTGEISGNNDDDDGNGYKDDIHGYDFYGKTGDVTADTHGTHVAGTIAAVNNNSKGVAGVAGGTVGGNGVRLMSCQIFEAMPGTGSASSTDIERAFVYAADNGAVISQNSWGYDTPGYQNATDLRAIKYFINEAGTDAHGNPRPNTPMVGGIVIFASGNNARFPGYNPANKYYPQAYDEVIAVAAVGPDGKRASYSNYGDWVDITAPGGHMSPLNNQVYSTLPGNSYGYDVGTSMACPHVSGVAALILSQYGTSTYTPDMLRDRLLISACSLKELDPVAAPQMGAGLVDAHKALAWVHVTGIALNHTSLNILDTHTAQLSANILPLNASNKKVVWTSSNPSCVSVDENGEIKAFYNGGQSATITARTVDGNFEATCVVTVHKEQLSISETVLKLLNGQEARLTAAIVPTNIANRQILWSSSNPACVSVDSNGNVTALCNGGQSATITARSDDGELEVTCEVLIYTEVSVPEGFSPNNDGHNDLFKLVLQENIKYTLRVFDKSGQLHYESLDYQNKWDGVANKGPVKGKKVSVGTYYYVLTNHEGLVKRGYVVIKY